MEVLQYLTAAAVLFAASSLAEHQFFYVNELKNWTAAQSFCRERFADLVTLSSLENVTTLVDMTDVKQMVNGDAKHRAWIGLLDDPNSWNWSLSDPNVFQKLGDSNFRNWQQGQPDNKQRPEDCVRIYDDGLWNDWPCGNNEKSVCANVSGADVTFVLVEQFFSWADALANCRQHYTDLAIARDLSENKKIKQVMPPGHYAWIGLNKNSLAWVDGTRPAFTYWRSGEPNNDEEKCTIANFDDSGKWEDCPCDWNFPFFCYGEQNVLVPVSQQVVKLKVATPSSLDLNDAALLEDLLMKFGQKLKDDGVEGGVSLSWKEQPDGTTFHKEG
ncbi:macrophage mannose receptor 1-like [Poecilia formosa]|uniref:macrophage mannose receptor 1-like n=1 Tax=Poecilia formosa TaxID=48698 RepID=UPI0007BADC63|nr:PREDICTED: macrophage mannose receptor 1-like [Poecilia formosa]